MILSNSDAMNPGQVYTFTFSVSAAILLLGNPQDTLLADLQAAALDDLSAVQINYGKLLLANSVDVVFTYAGNAGQLVADVASEITSAIEGAHWLVSFPFISATDTKGGLATDQKKQQDSSLDWVGNAAIIAAVLLGLLVLFEGISTVKEIA